MLHVYYGDGKGKTSAAVGAAVRAAGAGMRVLFLSFLKNGDSSECEVLKNIPGVTFAFADEPFELFIKPDEEKIARLRASYAALLACAEQEMWEMLILDEAIDACVMKLTDEQALLRFLQDGEVIVTGHSLPEIFREKADYLTHFVSEKHPYEQGVAARKGIEY